MKILLLLTLLACTVQGSQQSSQPLSPLFKAIQDNDLATLTNLVQASEATSSDILNNAAFFDKEKRSPLAFAVTVHADLSTVQFLVTQGASLTFVHQKKRSQEGENLLQLLFKKPDNPLPQGMLSEKRDRYVSMIGHYLARAGVPMYTQDPVKSILESLTDRPHLHKQFARLIKIDGRHADGSTDLIHAVKNEDTDTVCKLLENGASPNVPDLTGTTPLHYACHTNNIPLIRLLLQAGASIDTTQRNRSGLTQLDVAISLGNLETVQMLVDHNPGIVNPTGRPGPIIKSFTTTDGAPGIMGNCTTPLHLACSLPDERMVTILMAKCANIDTQDRYGNTALHIAAHSGKTTVVEQLLQKSASVDIPNKKGRTALFCACANGQKNVVTALLKAGANPHQKDNLTETPLVIASRNGHIKIAQALLAAAPDVLADKHGFTEQTILEEGLRSQHPEIISLFRTYQERSFQNALWEALENNNLQALSKEVQKNGIKILNNPDYFTEHGLSPLAQAFARCAPPEVIEFLIKNGAQIASTQCPHHTKNPLEKHATILTKSDQSLELVCVEAERVLLAQKKSRGLIDQYLTSIRSSHPEPNTLGHKAIKDVTDVSNFFTALSDAKRKKLSLSLEEINTLLPNGSTLLIEAAREGVLEDVEKLLQAGADPCLKNRRGNTALHEATFRRNKEVVTTLLKTTIPVNAQGGFGTTALQYAVQQGDLEMTALLLEAGAWSTLQNRDGKSSMDTAFDSKNHEAFELLLRKMNKSEKDWFYGKPLLMSACSKKGYTHMAALLLKYGTPANCDGSTPLHEACKEGIQPTVDLLLIYGASVDSESDQTRRTPLFLACLWGHLEVVARLLKAQANPQLKDTQDTTPLQAAAANGYTNIVDLLLRTPDGQATLISKNSDGNTALHLACQNGHPQTAKRLLEQCTASLPELITQGCEKESSVQLQGNEAQSVIALKNRQGKTALALACQNGKIEVVRLVLEQWASSNKEPKLENQTLSRNTHANNYERKVLQTDDAQALIAATDLQGKNALHHTCQTANRTEIVKLLLAYGAGALVNQQDADGKTALFLACESGNADTADLLLCNGADEGINDKNGNTLLHAAMGNRHIRLARMLINLNPTWMYQFNDERPKKIPAELFDDYQGLEFYEALWQNYNIRLPKSVGLDALAKGYRLPKMWEHFCNHSR